MLTLFAATGLYAQQVSQEAAPSGPGGTWTLGDCIDYAQKNNISVQQKHLEVEKSDVQLSTARYSRLPDLSANIDGEASFGRTTASDNTYRNNNQTSAMFSVTASVPIFKGMRINREIKGSKLELAAAIQDLEKVRENVAVNVMTFYLQVLFSKELEEVAVQQLALSTQQAERSRELVASGKQPESAYYESEALRAKDELNLTQAHNDLQLALLDLSQTLNRESAAGFDVEYPHLDSLGLEAMHNLGNPDAVYDFAVANRPHIKAEQLRLESSENSIRIAKSELIPTLSLMGGYKTGWYSTLDQNFKSQFRDNSREYVGVTLAIPIFNRRATRNNIRSTQIAMRNQQLTLSDAKLSLRKEIEQAYYNANAAYEKYRSADKALASARVAFVYEQQKADAGRSTVFDFNDAKTRMQKAESEMIQAKYEFVFRAKILDYYRGLPLLL